MAVHLGCVYPPCVFIGVPLVTRARFGSHPSPHLCGYLRMSPVHSDFRLRLWLVIDRLTCSLDFDSYQRRKESYHVTFLNDYWNASKPGKDNKPTYTTEANPCTPAKVVLLPRNSYVVINAREFVLQCKFSFYHRTTSVQLECPIFKDLVIKFTPPLRVLSARLGER